MTKQEAQEKYNQFLAIRQADRKYNRFINEGGEGYERETKTTLVDEIVAAGFCPQFDTKKVYDESDWLKIREEWNNAVRSTNGKVDIPAWIKISGHTLGLVQSLKNFFVKESK